MGRSGAGWGWACIGIQLNNSKTTWGTGMCGATGAKFTQVGPSGAGWGWVGLAGVGEGLACIGRVGRSGAECRVGPSGAVLGAEAGRVGPWGWVGLGRGCAPCYFRFSWGRGPSEPEWGWVRLGRGWACIGIQLNNSKTTSGGGQGGAVGGDYLGPSGAEWGRRARVGPGGAGWGWGGVSSTCPLEQ